MASTEEHQLRSHRESPVPQELRCRSERSHVEALLAISDEVFFQQLQPFQALSGCEEAVRGWDRGSPLGITPQSQHRDSKAHLESSSLLSAKSPTDHGDNQTQPSKSTHLCDQEHTSQKNTSVAVSSGLKTTAAEERKEVARTSAQPQYLPRPVKPPKHVHRPNNAAVPIKNFTFLPPIKSPHCTSDQAGSRKGGEEILHHTLDRKKGFRADACQDLPLHHINHASRSAAGQHTYLFSASVPKRYLTPSRPEAAHYSLGKAVPTARANMQPKCLFS
ncbi:uncharacterized protein LOC128759427 [Synchiropus splendidus]|uniref:uncharacterized protein LOC128759427 n=1 Tax=Synchiropus splendidus TaxID=270530 RepID=UPI00237E2953|nr:uncharacterized protein LOC128759427 [Synchiropus splendidus]